MHPIDDSAVVALRGNTHPLARAQFDRGVVSGSTPAARMLLVLKRTAAQEADLQQFLRSIQDRNSVDFGKFLTPEQFGERFGASGEDIQQLSTWLSGHGFAVGRVTKGRTAIEFSGSVGEIEETFHTQIHRYRVGGEEHLANSADPMIPAALAPVVAGISPLHDFFPRPQFIRGTRGEWSALEQRFVPELSIGSGSNELLFVGPGDAATIYDAPNAMNTHLATGQATLDGTGVTVGIVEDASAQNINVNDVSNYRALFGLPATTYSVIDDGPPGNYFPDDTESSLDGEAVSAIAPGAKLVYYEAWDTTFQPGLYLAMLRAVEDDAVNILSVSWGGCEAAQGAAGNAELLNLWEQAAAEGIAVTVSTGDSGAAGCDNPNVEVSAVHGLAVNALASTPYTVAVGGTDFDPLAKNFTKYATTTNGANYTSALGYIPEYPWNDSTSVNGALSGNQAEVLNDSTLIAAGGGGASSAAMYDANGSVVGGYPKPAWQQQFENAAGVTADQVRDVPDVSLLAGNGLYDAAWAVCLDQDCTGTNPSIHGVGGTSAAAPAFAGVLALINQKAGATKRLGQVNWSLYKVAGSSPSAFHAIATGNNSVVCTQGSPNCGANGFLTGYNAGAAYNLATGLGSVDITTLVNSWSSVALTPTSTTLTVSPTSFTHGSAATATIGVTPGGASGAVALLTDANEKTGITRGDGQTVVTLSGGAATATWAGYPGGTYDVYARYGGDGTYAASASPMTTITVTPENSLLQISATTAGSNGVLSSIAGQTITYGTYASVDAEPIGQSQVGKPSPITNATGTIYFVDSASGGANQALDATGNAEYPVHYPATGSHSVSASYNGDNSYGPSTSTTVSFTVQKASTTLSLSASGTTGTYTAPSITAAVMPGFTNYFAAPPDGLVVFTDTTTGTVLDTDPVFAAQDPKTGVVYGEAVLNPTLQQLILGANTITATYNGGTNYTGSQASSAVTITCTANCGNGTGQSLGLSFYQSTPQGPYTEGASFTTPVAVSGNGGFSGLVNLSCSVAGANAADINVPQCSFSPGSVTPTSAQVGQTTLTITTTAATSASLAPQGWMGNAARGMVVLACVVFLGIPARRRSLGAVRLLLCVALAGGLMACGGGGSSGGGGGGGGGGGSGGGGGGGGGKPGTTPDTYTVTFNAVDAATGKLNAQDYFKFIVLGSSSGATSSATKH